MTIFRKPKNADMVRTDNVVIGYYEDMAIIRNEEDNLFFFYCGSDGMELGTVVENEYLAPITNLLPSQQKQILKKFG